MSCPRLEQAPFNLCSAKWSNWTCDLWGSDKDVLQGKFQHNEAVQGISENQSLQISFGLGSYDQTFSKN